MPKARNVGKVVHTKPPPPQPGGFSPQAKDKPDGASTIVNSAPQRRRWSEVHCLPAPDKLHELEHDIAETEGDQKFGHVAELVHPAQRMALEQGAQ
jgi:hypothetical protein